MVNGGFGWWWGGQFRLLVVIVNKPLVLSFYVAGVVI